LPIVQLRFIYNIAERGPKAPVYKSGSTLAKNGKINLLVNACLCVVQQVVSSDYCIAEKDLKNGIVVLVFFAGAWAFSRFGHWVGCLGRKDIFFS